MKLLKTAALALFSTSSLICGASETDGVSDAETDRHLVSLDAEARLDWQYVSHDGTNNSAETGFVGKYLALRAHGELYPGLSYAWTQRLSRTSKDGSFWDQTEILEFKYDFGKFDVGAGKQLVKIGGYEYNSSPVDHVFPSVFVSNVNRYQFGISAGYRITPHDHLALQISQSPFSNVLDRNMYAFSLEWTSKRRLNESLLFETIWSVNELEYFDGKYCNYVALGNKLTLNRNLTFLLDLMTRTYPENKAFKNNTFAAEVAWNIDKRWQLTGKASYDCNRGRNQTIKTEVARGSQIASAGIIGTWFPIRSKRHLLRVHAALFYSAGTNHNVLDLMQGKTFFGSVGVTWNMNMLNFK